PPSARDTGAEAPTAVRTCYQRAHAPPGRIPVAHRTIDDLDHEELATLVKEHLLAGHLIDRAGMPTVIGGGIDVMRDVAIDEWMGASPIYTKRTQRLLKFEGDTVEACFKSMQLEIGAPPEFMDFRYTVIDDNNGL